HVHGEGDATTADGARDLQFARVRAGAGNIIGQAGINALKAELDVVKTSGEQFVEARVAESDARRDQVDVKMRVAGRGREFHHVRAGQRLPPGKVHLHNPEFSRLLEDADPLRGREFAAARCHLG